MASAPDNLGPMIDKLQLWTQLDEDDRLAIIALPHIVRHLRAGEFIVREDDQPQHSSLLLSGFAFRHKIAGNGGRQIFSVHMAGDIVDLPNAILGRADHNIQTLTPVTVALIAVSAIRAIVAERPTVARALWFETLVDASIFREWTLNIGRRDARVRTAHLLCEFAVRLNVVKLGSRVRFELPMTQEQLADALALTNVHVSRTLKALAGEGLITRNQRWIEIVDFARLATIGDFDSGYLHLDRVPVLRRDRVSVAAF